MMTLTTYHNRLPWSVHRNPAFATAWLEASKPANLSVTYIIYPVPGTPTQLRITVWDQALPQLEMSAVILRTANYIERRLISHPEDRNTVLDREHDPFWYEAKPAGGVILGIWSTPPKRLTYGEVGNVAQGLWKAMYQERKYSTASFEIYNKDRGLIKVGDGVIRRGYLRASNSRS